MIELKRGRMLCLGVRGSSGRHEGKRGGLHVVPHVGEQQKP